MSLPHPAPTYLNNYSRLQGNPVCANGNLVDFCQPQDEEFRNRLNVTDLNDCPPQACPHPFEYAPATSVISCFCAAPLLVGYRLKSPGFSDFPPYLNSFKEYISSGLEMNTSQLDIDSVAWQKGPRLRMYLKIFPAYVNDSVRKFNRSEVIWIREMFSGWRIPDNQVFGPYEFLNFTLLDPYRAGKLAMQDLHKSKGVMEVIVCLRWIKCLIFLYSDLQIYIIV